MTQFYSRNDVNYSGDVYSIPFDYIDKKEVKVYIDDELWTEWHFLNKHQLTLDEVPAEIGYNNIISVRRETDIEEKVVTYDNNSLLNKENLNKSQDQLLYAVQEIYDNNVQFQSDIREEVDEKVERVSDAVEKLEFLEDSVETATEAALEATEQAQIATEKAEETLQTYETALNEFETIRVNNIDEINDIVADHLDELNSLEATIKKDAEDIINRVGFNMFDTVLKDHILTYEESKGLALQGTYVYKEAIAGSRYGYADFYNKCLEEYNEAREERWKQPVLTGNTTQVAEGEIVCTASSYYATENRQPYCAMDGVKSGTPATLGEFTLGDSKTGWWQVKFPYKIKITGLKYYAPYSTTTASYIATTGRFYTSSDKTTPIGDGLSATDNWQIVDIANIPSEGIITDTIYFDITDSGYYGGIGELEITATRAGIVRNSNGHIFYDIAIKDQIDELFTTTGIAWLYGVDTENERIFLPRDKYFAIKGIAPVVGNGITVGWTDGTATKGASGGVAGGANGAIGNTVAAGVEVGSGKSTIAGWSGGTTALGISTDPELSGIEAHLQAKEDKYLYICVGNTESKGATTEVIDVTTTENDTTPLFTGLYFDFKPNNLSWLKGGEQANSSGVYTFCYNELVNELTTPKYNLKVVNEADMIAGVDYSEYWKVNQDEMTFTTPTAISSKAYANIAPVVGNGKTLGLNTGTQDALLFQNSSSGAYLTANTTALGQPVGTNYGSFINTALNQPVGVSTDPTKSGIEAHLVENTTAQLYFKVANAVQNLELLDAGEVLEALADKISRQDCKAYIVETYRNGSSWYRVWSDGWCEQGGVTVVPTSAGAVITFLKPFKDNNYWGMVNLSATDLGAAYYEAGIVKGSKTNTSMTILSRNYGDTNIREYYWEVKGYIN